MAPYPAPSHPVASDSQRRIIEFCIQNYFSVIPKTYRLHCHFNSRILKNAFCALGLDAEVLPCQVVCSAPDSVTILGFAATPESTTSGWTGHAICRVNDWLVDAACSHFNEFKGIPTPEIAYSNIFTLPSPILGRFKVSNEIKIWWMKLPPDFEVTYPEENEDLIILFSRKLEESIRRALGF